MQCKKLFDYNVAYAVCQYDVTEKKQKRKSVYDMVLPVHDIGGMFPRFLPIDNVYDAAL